MVIGPEKLVTLRFMMGSQLPDGTVKNHPEEEMSFIFQVDRQVPTLEAALEGRCAGEKLHLLIPDSEIYGKHDPELIREIPKKGLIKQRIKEGQFYRQMKMGSLVSFKILEVKPDTVVVDFNQPMAGIIVSLHLEILAVKEATRNEIESARQNQAKKRIGCG